MLIPMHCRNPKSAIRKSKNGGMQNHAQDTEAHKANDRDFGVAVDLYVPK